MYNTPNHLPPSDGDQEAERQRIKEGQENVKEFKAEQAKKNKVLVEVKTRGIKFGFKNKFGFAIFFVLVKARKFHFKIALLYWFGFKNGVKPVVKRVNFYRIKTIDERYKGMEISIMLNKFKLLNSRLDNIEALLNKLTEQK